MENWIFSIAGIIILTTVLGLIIPNGKTNKIIKCIYSFLIVFVFVSPVLNIKNGNIFPIEQNDFQIDFQNDFLYYSLNKKIENLEFQCEKLLENSGFFNVKISIEFLTDDNIEYSIKNVNVNLKNMVIKNDNVNINNNEIGKTISNYLNIDINKVIYEC